MENIGDFTNLHNEKNNLEVTFKRNRFGYWNLCKRLPNFVNVAALIDIHTILIAVYCLLVALSYLKSLMLSNSKVDYLYADNICITWTFMYI